MSPGARRLHRLPQRLDYSLIPAPLDLSLPQATEKSPLPAIIVTPSSPSLGAPEYYIAFLNPPPKPSLRERIMKSPVFQGQILFKARTLFIISLLLFILVCHLLAHLALHRPHFNFTSSNTSTHSDSHGSFWDFVPFDFRSFCDSAINGDKRSYMVQEVSQAGRR